ncbi:MAG: polysaccharide deacetylase family protein [Clostridia bacterium]|nr:polysaccharide deacetylase family protein [Clostridia bacterium]
MNCITFNYYPNKKTKAITMSFDDGRTYDRDLIKIFNKYNIKGTFHLISNRIDTDGYITSEEIKNLYNGHEISLHTHTHPTIAHMPNMQVNYELSENKRILEKLSEKEVCGMSYPMGSFGSNVTECMKALGILYGRTTLSTGKFSLPDDFLLWHPTIHYSRGTKKWSKNITYSRSILDEKLSEFTEYPEWIKDLPLMQIWGHSYELADNDDWDIMENFCKKASCQKNIWFATNIEIVDYVNALKHLRFSYDCDIVYNPSAIDVWIGVNGEPVIIKANERRILK